MPTASERQALWFFALVALSGSAVRLFRGDPEVSSAGLEHQIRRVDSARNVRPGRARPVRKPDPVDAGPRAPVDLDRASAAEIEALPGIGPALAARIVAHRDSAGPFGWMDAVCEVRGVGPALSERLSPLVTFSGPRRPVSAACGEGSKAAKKTRAVRHRK